MRTMFNDRFQYFFCIIFLYSNNHVSVFEFVLSTFQKPLDLSLNPEEKVRQLSILCDFKNQTKSNFLLPFIAVNVQINFDFSLL